MNNYDKTKLMSTIGLSTILFSTIATFSFNNEVKASPVQLRAQTNTAQQQGESINTVEGSNCRQVNADDVTLVSDPTGGKVIGSISKDEQVIIANEGNDGWVPIESPASAYIESKYLTDCETQVVTDKSSVSLNEGGEEISTVPGSNCRQVVSDGLQVMTRPMQTVVGELTKGQQVMIANEGFSGWVPIETPISGFIRSVGLTECDIENSSSYKEVISTVPGSNCREILSPNVLVRKEPKGEVIGQLEKGQQVMIANEGYNGWVPIEQPSSGYVTSPNLGLCMP